MAAKPKVAVCDFFLATVQHFTLLESGNKESISIYKD